MEKSYKYISYFFLALLAITVFGFKKYFLLFPNFEDFTYVHHLHSISLLLWFAMLFVQPILIYQKKIELHRLLGKFSYILVPFIVYCMLLAIKNQYLKGVEQNAPENINLAFIYLPTAAMVPFIIIYLLAILNKRKPKIHMRYMIATAVSLLGPGIGRIHFGFTDLTTAIMFAFALSDLFFIGLLAFEYFKTKVYKPYTVSLLICLFFHGIYPFFPSTDLWLLIARKLVLWF